MWNLADIGKKPCYGDIGLIREYGHIMEQYLMVMKDRGCFVNEIVAYGSAC